MDCKKQRREEINTRASKERKTTPSVQRTMKTKHTIDVTEKVREKIHINATRMCITYHISFVCGLTNPSERERINNQYAQPNPPFIRRLKANRLKTRCQRVELCRVAAPLKTRQKCRFKGLIRRGKYLRNPFSQGKRRSGAVRGPQRRINARKSLHNDSEPQLPPGKVRPPQHFRATKRVSFVSIPSLISFQLLSRTIREMDAPQ